MIRPHKTALEVFAQTSFNEMVDNMTLVRTNLLAHSPAERIDLLGIARRQMEELRVLVQEEIRQENLITVGGDTSVSAFNARVAKLWDTWKRSVTLVVLMKFCLAHWDEPIPARWED